LALTFEKLTPNASDLRRAGKTALFIQTSLWWKTTYDAENRG
jgi:hypothetical protein